MISKNKVELLFRLRNLRLKRIKINTEIKQLLTMLKDDNIHSMTQRQRRNIYKARAALEGMKNKKHITKKS